jgi:3',5'-cyclic AMP phosphodiesterase CpdA
MQRRNFFRLAGAGMLAASFGARKIAGAGDKSFRFVHFTDLHVKPEDGAEQGVRKAIEAVNKLDPAPDFVISGGDLVSDALDVSFERADTLFKLYQDCAAGFNMPVHDVIGNHDILGWYKNSGVSPEHPEYGKQIFAKRLGNGSTWKSFDHKGWHFVLLDSIEFDKESGDYMALINPEQMAWLENDLADVSDETPLVVVTHIPLISSLEQLRGGANAPLNPRIGITNSMDVFKLLENKNLQLVLQGHLHRDEQIRVDGRWFCMSGAVCGAWWKGPNVTTQEGFGVIDVSGGNIACNYYDYGWEVQPG